MTLVSIWFISTRLRNWSDLNFLSRNTFKSLFFSFPVFVCPVVLICSVGVAGLLVWSVPSSLPVLSEAHSWSSSVCSRLWTAPTTMRGVMEAPPLRRCLGWNRCVDIRTEQIRRSRKCFAIKLDQKWAPNLSYGLKKCSGKLWSSCLCFYSELNSVLYIHTAHFLHNDRWK